MCHDFLAHTVNAKFDGDGRTINVDADFETPSGRLFVEYDGSYWHRDKSAQDADMTQVLLKHGSVLRIRDSLAPIDGCDNIIVDAVKDKGDAMYRRTFDHVGRDAAAWDATWQRAQSLVVRTCQFLQDNKVQTLDGFLLTPVVSLVTCELCSAVAVKRS